MDCVFARRRFSQGVTLEDLFTNCTILSVRGVNQSDSSTGWSYVYKSSAPSSGVCYLFSVCDGYMGIYKLTNGTISHTALRRTNTSYGGVEEASNFYAYYNREYYYSAQGYGKTANGSTMALISFPYDASIVDGLLATSGMTETRLAGRNSSSAGSVSTSSKTDAVLMATKGSNIDFWKPNGTTYTKINGTSAAAASTSGSNLTLGSVYGGSIIGLK